MTDKHSRIQAQLDAIRVSYIASLKDKRTAILSHWTQLQSGWDSAAYDQLYLLIHGLAGSAETFGLPQITQQARHVVDRFKSFKSPAAADHAQWLNEIEPALSTLVQLLKQQETG